MNAPSNPCFTDFALQEFLMGRLDPDVRKDIEKHSQTCEQCAACLELLRKETEALRSFLMPEGAREVSTDDPTDLELAMFIDGSLKPDIQARVENLIAGSPEHLQRFVSLYRDLADMQQQNAPTAAPAKHPPSTPRRLPVLLRMPQRKVTPRTIADLGGEQAQA